MRNVERYKQCQDEELIVRLRNGEEAITDYIMEKYKNLVRSKAKSMFILGADNEDLIQEGMIGLFKAIRDYDMGRDASFYTFADLCIARQMYTAVQSSNRKKHAPLNTSISLNAEVMLEGELEGRASAILMNVLATNDQMNPESVILDQERVANMEAIIAQELSGLELQVLELYITGMSYTEIAKVLNQDPKTTDNALQRMKAKLKKAL
ncbi:MAG: RNA polymerase sporulation sigma factor SigH [Eubacteriales bacterium]